MKPRILVIYYSQTGQLREILESVLTSIRDDVEVTFAPLEPVTPFPFPWTAAAFFDAMPECVVGQPGPVKPLDPQVMAAPYDLVLLGYQPWFLHPSQPVTAFLKSPQAAMLKDVPVVTVVGCRNMWLNAQECVKKELNALGAKLVGNIVLHDTHPNLVSTLTVMRWAFSGRKAASRFLPAADVQDSDIRESQRFGPLLLVHLRRSAALQNLHEELLLQRSVVLDPALMLMEQRGVRIFRRWAHFIRLKGGPRNPARAARVTAFRTFLTLGIFVLSPLSALLARVRGVLQKGHTQRELKYFRGLEYQSGRI